MQRLLAFAIALAITVPAFAQQPKPMDTGTQATICSAFSVMAKVKPRRGTSSKGCGLTQPDPLSSRLPTSRAGYA